MNKNRIPQKKHSYVLAEFEGDLLLYSPEKDDVLVISESGAIIWQLCDGKRSQEDIASLLKESYPDKSSSIEADIQDFFTEVDRWGALTFL